MTVGAASPESALPTPPPLSARDRKLRQAAFAYLHVGILYEAAVLAVWRAGIMPQSRGPMLLWLLLGVAIVAAIFWGLYFKRSVWFARVVWGVHALRIPFLMEGAFFPAAGAAIPPSFYLVALVVVVANLWMLARAGWDL